MIGKPIYGNGFRGALAYLKLGNKETTKERVEWTSTRNLSGLDAEEDHREIGREMRATANLSSRTKKPVIHLPISWSKEDTKKLTRENMEEMTDKIIKDLGLEEHQVVIFSHDDTEHKHVHILANRIHPETGKAWSTSRDYQRINKSLASLEKEFDLERVDHWGIDLERDLERVEERMKVDDFDTIGPRPSDGEIKQAEKEGRLPDMPFSKTQIKDIREFIGDEFGVSKSWPELEDRLARKGFNMIPKGQGAVITDGFQVAKLSQMGKGIRLKALEESYGKSYRDWNADRSIERSEALKENLDSAALEEPNFDNMSAEEKRTAKRIWEARMRAARIRAQQAYATGDKVKDFDLADMEVRYWQGMERTYKDAEKQHNNAKRRQKYHEGKLPDAGDWLDKRREDFLATFEKAYRNPHKASAKWDELIAKHGRANAGVLIRQNPQVLGRLQGRRQINVKSVLYAFRRTKHLKHKFSEFKEVRFWQNNDKRKESVREARKLTRQYDRFRKSQDIYFDTREKVKQAKHEVELTKERFDNLKNSGLEPKGLRLTLKFLYTRRVNTLNRVTKTAILKSDLADERKEQLERTRRLHNERKLKREKTRERGRAYELDLENFDE